MQALARIHPLLPESLAVVGLLCAVVLAHWLTNRYLVSAVRSYVGRTAHTWDDILVEHRVFARLAQLVPAYVVYLGIDMLPGLGEKLRGQVLNLTGAYIVAALTLTATALLGAANAIYETRPGSGQRPVKGFVQVAQIVLLILGFLLVLASLLDQSPLVLLSGFGAMTAVLMLVFKDTILSLVASVQLTAQDLVRVGDWIEAPQFGADGDVTDVQLHAIKVQNWDRTITTIPTHSLLAGSFKNWRGMTVSGGRRIKRALRIDASSIRFLTEEEVARFKRFALLADYIAGRQADLEAYNRAVEERSPAGASANVNLRRLTNIGTLRAYARNYLKSHPRVQNGMTLLVRQLQAGPQGLPLEIYCFANTTDWDAYEGIQADLFDHLLAIVPEFGLRLYQQPAGFDFADASASGPGAAPARALAGFAAGAARSPPSRPRQPAPERPPATLPRISLAPPRPRLRRGGVRAPWDDWPAPSPTAPRPWLRRGGRGVVDLHARRQLGEEAAPARWPAAGRQPRPAARYCFTTSAAGPIMRAAPASIQSACSHSCTTLCSLCDT